MNKIKIRKADTVFSNYIRTKANWTCQRCGKHYDPPTTSLQCCHFHSRRKESVRFDIDNVQCMCYGCHAYIDSHPLEKVEYFKKILGEKSFDDLTLRANITRKKDDALQIIIYTKLLEEITHT